MLHKTAPRSERKLRLRRQETRVVFFSSGPVNCISSRSRNYVSLTVPNAKKHLLQRTKNSHSFFSKKRKRIASKEDIYIDIYIQYMVFP